MQTVHTRVARECDLETIVTIYNQAVAAGETADMDDGWEHE